MSLFAAAAAGLVFSVGFSLFTGDWLRGEGGMDEAEGVFDLEDRLRYARTTINPVRNRTRRGTR
jgi:hypothetical protein